MIQIHFTGTAFLLPIKIPIWDTSHLEDERYEIAPGTCTRCPTMNWDLYRENRRHCKPALYRSQYSGWPSYNRQILPGAEPGSYGAGTVETAPGPGTGSGGGNCVPPEPGMGGKPHRIGTACTAGYASQSADQVPECKHRPIAGGIQSGVRKQNQPQAAASG